MKETVSFFFLGTACHHSSYQDALTVFHKAAALNANKPGSKVAVHLFDGVGSDPGELADIHPTPGRYLYDAVNNLKLKVEDGILESVRDLMQQVTGCLAGDGMDDLLFEATLFLEQLIRENNGVMPKTVNLHGYSRGADSCVRLANLLDSLYPDVKVNLFLVDHVPGPWRADDPNSYVIPKNVQRIDAAVMLHENTPCFAPQDRSRYVFTSPHTTKVAIKVYPGGHGQAMLLTPEQETNHVAKLAHDDFYRFCQETGSLSERDPIPPYKVRHTWTSYSDEPAEVLTKEQRFEYYNEMQESWLLYSKSSAINPRNVLSNHQHYSQDHRLFVNQEHGELFMELFPNLYQWFYEGIKVDRKRLLKELAILEHSNSKFYEKFCKVNDIQPDSLLPRPRKRRTYFRRQLGKTLVDDERSFLEQAIISVTNYETHHNEKNCETIAFAIRRLQAFLEHTAEQDDKYTCLYLKQKIANIVRYLAICDKKDTYLYRQLSKVCHSFQYIDRIIGVLEGHLKNNRELHLEQQNYIERLIEKLLAIKDDDGLNYMDKLKVAKSTVNSLSLHLQDPEDYRVLSYNLMSRSLYPINGKYTFPSLLKSLNELNSPGYSEASIASNIAKKFEAYYLRNMFWDSIHKLLSHIINIPPFFSEKKSDLAQEIYQALHKLDENGLGNDLTEVSKVLADRQKKVHEDYRANGKQVLGDFDKIMIEANGQLNMEINAFPFKETDGDIHRELILA
ncbi:hypothetical protein BN59_00779 [Legionella massiliensis]|uniref:DUF5621 domain-containing protein n=1 Tax=Legionella massiliensis TaxID=1034943 RepID=A0A078KXN2_9GAMM|nr:DUF5621 domain-containing protein [Legionella massiliensis]CDZ76509.1 hypothetical protein BN59_00779 [Legionella massiliensis]CEE12247.1 hypothetical protein BN1094_00779 [Legionella massiliensis]